MEDIVGTVEAEVCKNEELDLLRDGITIGDNIVIGAGSVVTKDIPANHIAYGVPCKPIRMITEKRFKIRFDLR